MADLTLGIDLASQAENTAVCLIAWRTAGAEVRLFERGRTLDDARLLALMCGDGGPSWPAPDGPALKIGIDAPLGWPVAFIRAVADVDAWPLAEEVDPGALVRRRADHWIHAQTGKVPLSVSTDRIAYPAMRAARLLRRYREITGASIDRSGMSGPVAEVYPDTGVTRFRLRPPQQPRLSYKGGAGAGAREQLLGTLAGLAPWLTLAEGQRQACVASDDHFDALIAALVTRSVQLGVTGPPPAEMAAEAALEGWIHLPEWGGLDQLAPRA